VGFKSVALVLLNDGSGAQQVGSLLVEVVTGRQPLEGVSTRERFEKAVGACGAVAPVVRDGG
jgi:hypothetical protein